MSINITTPGLPGSKTKKAKLGHKQCQKVQSLIKDQKKVKLEQIDKINETIFRISLNIGSFVQILPKKALKDTFSNIQKRSKNCQTMKISCKQKQKGQFSPIRLFSKSTGNPDRHLIARSICLFCRL